MLIRRLAQALLATLITSTTLAGCADNPDNTDPLPEARQLVDAAATELGELTSVKFELDTSGTIHGLPVRTVEGIAAARDTTGDPYRPHGIARGDADVQYPAERVQYEFVLDADGLQLSEADGDTLELPAPEPYTPARLLDPERGLRQLLTKTTTLRTETREVLDDVATYRIGGELAQEAIASVVPGVQDAVDVKFWIAHADDRLMRMWIQVPPRVENEGAVQLELALTDHNAAIPACDPVFTSAGDSCGTGSPGSTPGRP